MVKMPSARFFWVVSLFMIGSTLVMDFIYNKVFPFGIFEQVLLYAMLAGFVGFLLRQRWGYLLTIGIQVFILIYLVFFSNWYIVLAPFQAIGIFVLFLSRPFFK